MVIIKYAFLLKLFTKEFSFNCAYEEDWFVKKFKLLLNMHKSPSKWFEFLEGNT